LWLLLEALLVGVAPLPQMLLLLLLLLLGTWHLILLQRTSRALPNAHGWTHLACKGSFRT
jgi:hypothetical protein